MCDIMIMNRNYKLKTVVLDFINVTKLKQITDNFTLRQDINKSQSMLSHIYY